MTSENGTSSNKSYGELYTDGETESPTDYPTLQDKHEKARAVIKTALQKYTNPAIMWTGGKDSTLVLYFVKEVANELDMDCPPVIFIDHGQHFDTVETFIQTWATNWNLDVVYARNEDLLSLVTEPNETVSVTDLNVDNQSEVRDKLPIKKIRSRLHLIRKLETIY